MSEPINITSGDPLAREPFPDVAEANLSPTITIRVRRDAEDADVIALLVAIKAFSEDGQVIRLPEHARIEIIEVTP